MCNFLQNCNPWFKGTIISGEVGEMTKRDTYIYMYIYTYMYNHMHVKAMYGARC